MKTSQKDKLYTIFWIGLALLFNLYIYFAEGSLAATNFLTAYLVEKSLSVDNLFVFLLIFKAFHITPLHQHKILHWGILGAIVMRIVFIFAGLALIQRFTWLFYVFGAFLIYAGYRLMRQKEEESHPEKNPIILLLEKWIPVTHSMESGQFFYQGMMTPLFLALIAIETSDLIFALDSIPAVIGITTDPFIVISSNLFAILGLRSLYFVLESKLASFEYLHWGLSAILIFIGIKMFAHSWIQIPPLVSLIIILTILAFALLPSLFKRLGRNQ
jgi:tellurite resistance protein TerC